MFSWQRISASLMALVWVAIAAAMGASCAWAEDQRELKTESSDKLDAVLLLDSSGSMLTTDPLRLRDEGARLFTQLLRPGDRVAVIQFDREAHLVHRFAELGPDELSKVASDITHIGVEGQYTDLLAGIEAARDLLKQEKRPDATGIVLMMSDGKMDPDPAIGTSFSRSEQLLNAVLPELKAAGIKVHTVYFSEQADKQLLSEIALATEGASSFANNVENIHKSFADLFLAAKKPQVVPLIGRGFTIDSDVQEATFYLNKEGGADLALITPAKKEIRAKDTNESVKWFSGQKFDVITIERPEAGQWQVQGLTSQDGFATVLTNLKLVSDWPNAVTSEQPTLLQVRLNEGEKPVVLPEVSTNTKYGVQIVPTHKVAEPVFEDLLFDDATHGDKVAGDGIFSNKITIEEPGEYRMWLVAKAPTFERRQQLPFKVRPPLVQILLEKQEIEAEVGPAHDKKEEHHEEGTHEDAHSSSVSSSSEATAESVHLLVKLSTEALQLRNIEVKLLAIDESRKRYAIALTKGKDPSEFEVALNGFPHSGPYTLQATLKGEAKKRGEIEEESRPVKFVKTDGPAPSEIVTVVAEEKKPDAPPSPWPWAALVLLLNGGASFGLLKTLKKLQSTIAVSVPVFLPATAGMEAVAELEARSLLTSIDFNDPILQAEVIIPGPPAALAANAPAAAASEAPPPAPETPAPAEAEPAKTEEGEE